MSSKRSAGPFFSVTSSVMPPMSSSTPASEIFRSSPSCSSRSRYARRSCHSMGVSPYESIGLAAVVAWARVARLYAVLRAVRLELVVDRGVLIGGLGLVRHAAPATARVEALEAERQVAHRILARVEVLVVLPFLRGQDGA